MIEISRSRVWWLSGWKREPPPRWPRTNIWTSHTPLKSWDLGLRLSHDVWGVQIFVRGRRVVEEWCGPWCSDPTIYDLLTRLLFSLTRVSTVRYVELRWVGLKMRLSKMPPLEVIDFSYITFLQKTLGCGHFCFKFSKIRTKGRRLFQTLRLKIEVWPNLRFVNVQMNIWINMTPSTVRTRHRKPACLLLRIHSLPAGVSIELGQSGFVSNLLIYDPLHRYEFGPPKFFSKTFKFSIIFYSTWQISGGGRWRKACRSRKKE